MYKATFPANRLFHEFIPQNNRNIKIDWFHENKKKWVNARQTALQPEEKQSDKENTRSLLLVKKLLIVPN